MNRLCRRRGATSLEFAFVLPVIVGLFSGAIDGAMYLCQRSVLVDAAAAGARAGAVSADSDDVIDDATAAVSARLAESGIDMQGATVTATQQETTTPLVVVVVTLPFESFVGLLPMPATLSAVSTAHYENTSST